MIGLLRTAAPQLQSKVYKAIDNIEVEDLLHVCTEWGFEVQHSTLATLCSVNLSSNHISRS